MHTNKPIVKVTLENVKCYKEDKIGWGQRKWQYFSRRVRRGRFEEVTFKLGPGWPGQVPHLSRPRTFLPQAVGVSSSSCELTILEDPTPHQQPPKRWIAGTEATAPLCACLWDSQLCCIPCAFFLKLLLFLAAPMAGGSSWVGSNPCHSSDPSCCSDNAGFLTHCNTTELFNVLFCAHFPPAAWNLLLLCLCVLEDHTVLGTQWAFAKYLWDCFEYKSTRNDDLIVSGACLMDHVLREAFA